MSEKDVEAEQAMDLSQKSETGNVKSASVSSPNKEDTASAEVYSSSSSQENFSDEEVDPRVLGISKEEASSAASTSSSEEEISTEEMPRREPGDQHPHPNPNSKEFKVRFIKAKMKLQFEVHVAAECADADMEAGHIRDLLATWGHEKMQSGLPQWCLVDRMGKKHSLSSTLVFLGREDCDIILQARSVDKKHAVLNFDKHEKKFRVKDLGSLNGTFVNGQRIAEQDYYTLDSQDTLRLGSDPMVYRMECLDLDLSISSPEVENPPEPPPPPLHPTKELPTWAHRHTSSSPTSPTNGIGMAECPGCIAEQGIQHTCGESNDCSSGGSTPRIHGNGCDSRSPAPDVRSTTPRKPSVHKWDSPNLQHIPAFHAKTYPAEEGSYSVGPGHHGNSHHDNVTEHSHWEHTLPQEYDHGNVYPPYEAGGIQRTYSESYHGQHRHSGHIPPQDVHYQPHVIQRVRPAYPARGHPLPHRPHPVHYVPAHAVYHDNVEYVPYHEPYVPQGYKIVPTEDSNFQGYAVIEELSPDGVPLDLTFRQQRNSVDPGPSPRTTPFLQSARTPISPEDLTKVTPSVSDIKTSPGLPLNGATLNSDTIPSHLNNLETESVSKSQTDAAGTSNSKFIVGKPPASPKKVSVTEDIDTEPSRECSRGYSQTGAAETPSSKADHVTTPNSTHSDRQDQRRPSVDGSLDTVKKGTPLYGQPSWWGEEDAETNYSYPHTSTLSERGKVATNGSQQGAAVAERPRSLSLEQIGNQTNMDSRQDPHRSVFSMDIPFKDSDRSGSSNKSSPDISAKETPHTPPERDPGLGDGQEDKGPAMAFTIDFGDQPTTRKAGMNESLSNFMPSKLRRSFKQRSALVKEKHRDQSDDGGDGSEDGQTNGVMSPPKSRRDVWNGSGRHKSPTRRSGYSSDGHHSALSSDNEDLSFKSDSYPNKGGRRSVTPRQSTSSTRPTPPSKLAPKPTRGSGAKTPTPSGRKTPTESKRLSGRKTPTDKKTKVEKKEKTSPQKEKKRGTDANYLIEKMLSSSNDANNSDLYEEEYLSSPRNSAALGRPVASTGEPKHSTKHSKPLPANVPDNLSDTGTYTIGVEEELHDLSDARESIDKLFGVSTIDSQDLEIGLKRPVIDPCVKDEVEDNEDFMAELDRRKKVARATAQQMVMDGNEMVDPAPVWMNQLANIKAQKTNGHSSSADIPDRQDVVLSPTSGRPCSRKGRSGTGRRLPTPPAGKSKGDLSSPSPSTHPQSKSSFDWDAKGNDADVEEDSPGRKRATVTFDSNEGSCFMVSYDAPQRETRSAPREIVSKASEIKSEVTVSETYESSSIKRRESARSVSSIDTETLLQDTERLVQAMTGRVSAQKKKVSVRDEVYDPQSDLFIPIKDSDSDNSSTCALVEDRDNTRDKPRFLKSKSLDARSHLASRSPRPAHDQSRVSKSRDPYQSTNRTRSSSTNKDLMASASESETGSIISTSTDYSESSPRMARKISVGKAPITSTRTNRAFALRRARTDTSDNDTVRSDTSTLTPRGSRPNSTTLENEKARSRSQSRSRSASRNRGSRPSSAQEVSRGKTADKNKDTMLSSGSTPALERKDGGRFSLRSTKSSNSAPTPTAARSRTPGDKKEPKKPNVNRSASAAGNVQAPGKAGANDRSSSPRSDEYSAWKRRKNYDPRQAVAQAKATKKPDLPKSISVGAKHQDYRKSTDRSVSSVSSEDSYYDERYVESPARTTEDIIQLSNEITSNLAMLSKADCDQEGFEFHNGLPSNSTKSAFSSLHTSSSIFEPINNTDGEDDGEEPEMVEDEDGDCDENGVQNDDEQTEQIWKKAESYDNLVVTSIHQLSLKVKSQADRLLTRVSEERHVRRTPSPVDEPLPEASCQELAAVLNNLRKTEHYLSALDKAMYPTKGGTHQKKYLRELERIRSEIAGFKPIDKANRGTKWDSDRQDSGESELTGEEYY